MPAAPALNLPLWTRKVSPTAHAPADHGQVAVLPDLTSCSIWSHGTGIACRIVGVDPDYPDDIRYEQVVALAVNGTSIYPGGESCEKPWIARLSETELVATWERQATADTTARIEGARIYKSGESWTVDAATVGSVGYPLDTSVADGDGDANCRTIFLENGYFVCSYATETANSGTAPHERTYTKRHKVFSWLAAGAPTEEVALQYTGRHWDDDDANPTVAGGYLTSHLCVTHRRDILVVWEERDHNGANYVNTLQARLIAGLYAASPFTEVQTATLLSVTDGNLALRRPSLASLNPVLFGSTPSPNGGEDVWMAFGEEDVDDPESSNAKLARISLYAGATMSIAEYVNWQANLGLNANIAKMISASAIHGRNIKGAICVANFDTDAGRTLSLQHSDGSHEWVATPVRWPDRPWGEIVHRNGREYLFLASEGFNDSGGDAERYLSLYDLGPIQ